MGIAFGSEKGKKVAPQIRDFFDGMEAYVKSARAYYESGFPPTSVKELNTVIWYAERLKDTIKREHPELWK